MHSGSKDRLAPPQPHQLDGDDWTGLLGGLRAQCSKTKSTYLVVVESVVVGTAGRQDEHPQCSPCSRLVTKVNWRSALKCR